MDTGLFIDASALSKCYAPERGSDIVERLMRDVPHERLACLLPGIGEVISVLVRKKNRGEIAPEAFDEAITTFFSDVIDAPDFPKVNPQPEQVTASWPFIQRYSLNATDATLLRVALDRADEARADGGDLVLVASDHRLLDAAKAEGLQVFDPENDPQAKLDQLAGTPSA